MSTAGFDDFIQSIKTELNVVKQRFKKKVEGFTEISSELEDNYFMNDRETGLVDRNGNAIKIGDTLRLILDDGSVRCFKVCYKTVKRKIFCNPVFEDETADVYITGIVFCWNGYDLFPKANITGESDLERMEIVK